MPEYSNPFRYSSSTVIVTTSTAITTLQGNSGGITIIGGTASGDDLTLQSTSNGTKGNIIFEAAPTNTSVYGFGGQYTFTTTSGSTAALAVQLLANPAGASTSTFLGSDYQVGSSNGNAQNFTATRGLIGFRGQILHRGTGTVTGMSTIEAAAPSVPNGGTVTDAYGVYITGHKVTGVTTGWGLYQAGASDLNYFAGNVGIGVTPTRILSIKAGSSTGLAQVGGVIFNSFTDATAGGAEADIYTHTTAASTLGTNADKILATYGGNFVTVGTELTQLKVYFAGTAIWDSTGVAPSTGTTSWRVNVEIIRVSSTVVRYTVSLNTTGASGYVYCTVGELTGLTLSNTNILKITGTSTGVGSGSGDIVGKMSQVEWKAAA